MREYIVSGVGPGGTRVTLATCQTEELATLIAAALKAYRPARLQEETNSPASLHTFRIGPDTVKVIWKAEAGA